MLTADAQNYIGVERDLETWITDPDIPGGLPIHDWIVNPGNLPEFTVLGALVAVAVVGYVYMKKRKK
jgi:hypothetical protein